MTYIHLMPPADTEFLTRAEVSALLRVSLSTVRNWSQLGLITAIKTPGGRRVIYRQSEIREFLERQEVTS